MTYHFTGMDELLHEAFSRFADRGVERFAARLADARTPAEALDAVVNGIIADIPPDRLDEQIVTYSGLRIALLLCALIPAIFAVTVARFGRQQSSDLAHGSS